VISIYKVAAYVWRNYEPARDWGKDILISWLGYHSMNRTLFIVLDDDENILGVQVARLVMKPEDAVHNGVGNLTHDPEGKYVWADMVCVTHPKALAILLLMMRERFGWREKIAYMRQPDTRIRVRDYYVLRRRLLRKEMMTYGE
jgi:hypothetical protein